MKNRLKGTGVAVITPFKNDSSIDFKALEKVIEHIISGRVNYLVLLGTTSEAVTLSQEEKDAVVSHVTEICNRRIPVVIGIGGNNTRQIENDILRTDFTGISAILSVAPYYNKPGQKGLYNHFKIISEASPVPVIVYNVPGRTCSNLEAGTTLKLAWDCKNIVAIKEASGDLKQVMEIIRDAPEDFLVISGDDLITLPLIALGAAGVISVLGNAFPAEWSEMVRLALKGNIRQASELHFKYLELIELLFADGNPAGVKAAMNNMNLCSNSVRLPLTPAGRTTTARISAIMADLKLVP
ncbi:MAG: 4-hydroxy-tetrahydrodipicolinate synthase [Bacteroidales bacterium]|nr:4-hydroxy-tetrahydrodipicolinate synthase [Bacteroidales bacterium]